MTPADEIARLRATVDRKDEQMAVLQDEIDRLRRELAACIEAARENGKERDELARALGAEVATTQRLKTALVEIKVEVDKAHQWHTTTGMKVAKTPAIMPSMVKWLKPIVDAALASGNGDRGGK